MVLKIDTQIDNNLIDRISKMVFEDKDDRGKVEAIQEAIVAREVLYGANLEETRTEQKPAEHLYSKLFSLVKKHFSRHHLKAGPPSLEEPLPSKTLNAPSIEYYSDVEKRKTWEALERIYKDKEGEAERIFEKIYNLCYPKISSQR